MVRREYPETAERIETKSYYRWQEENKKTLSVLGQMATEVAYGLMFYECMIAEKPYLERIERERAYRATKEAGDETAKGSGETGNGESGGTVVGEGEGGTRTQTINNKFPNDNQAGRTFDFTVEDGKSLLKMVFKKLILLLIWMVICTLGEATPIYLEGRMYKLRVQ